MPDWAGEVRGGLLLGVWALTLAPELGLDALPRGTEIAANVRTLSVLVVMAFLVGTVFGFLPLVAYRPARVAEAMREEGRTGTASRAGRVGRRVLAAVQVAGALMLLVAGAVLLASLHRVLAVDVGFHSEQWRF